MSGPPAPAPARLRLAHRTARRLRLRTAAPMDREAMAALAERIGQAAGVARVVARPNTGSVILETDREADAVLAALEAEGVVKLLPAPPAIPLGVAAKMGLKRLDREIGTRSGGTLDLRSGLAVTLIVGAGVQLARGQVAGPATALLAQGLALLDSAGRS